MAASSSDSISSKQPVLIIGAGLGGLALAQALHRQGIAYRLFERSPENDTRFQGWAISIHSWMMSDLRTYVRDDEPGLRACCTTLALGLKSELALYSIGPDGSKKELMRLEDRPENPWVRVDRAKLREWLIQDIKIEWGKRFVKYEEGEDSVTAHFEDGTEAKGRVLIGADGISSAVRNQLLPIESNTTRPRHLPMGIIVGELDASEEQFSRWLKLARSFWVANDETRRLFVSIKSISSDKKTARYYWLFSWHDDAAAKPPYWTANASREELHTYIMSHLDGLSPDLVEPIRNTKVEGMLHPPLQMRDMLPPELPKGRVTLLGDAVHPMIPFRGEGGNMAIKDAINLAALLAKKDGTEAPEVFFKEYEAEMRERTTKSVLGSRAAVNVATTV